MGGWGSLGEFETASDGRSGWEVPGRGRCEDKVLCGSNVPVGQGPRREGRMRTEDFDLGGSRGWMTLGWERLEGVVGVSERERQERTGSRILAGGNSGWEKTGGGKFWK